MKLRALRKICLVNSWERQLQAYLPTLDILQTSFHLHIRVHRQHLKTMNIHVTFAHP